MRAIVIERFGGPEVLRAAELADPEPGPGEVRVAVEAVAVARTKDVAARAGRPPFAPSITAFPHVLGTEHAGVVDAVGPGVDDRLVGSRVAVSAVLTCGNCRACGQGREEACAGFRLVGVHRPGSYAQFCVVPEANVQPVPEDVSLAAAASLAANGGVAAAQLDAGRVGPGSTVLVLGAAGSLGSTLAALAAFRGARVIGVDRLGRDPDRLAGLPLAAMIDGDRPDLAEALRTDVDGVGDVDGIDCVVDNLGITELWNAYLPALAPMGTIVMSGAISHDPVPVPLLTFYLRSQSLIGVRTGNRAQRAALWADVANGFRPPASHLQLLGWDRAAEAHAAVERGEAHGQIVLRVDAGGGSL
ncbi:quinone oxidoreductase family protein [Pseudonocardia cypriaca]|uniref:alcohol dehydrogenase n=1 Tax=Pseudonocardia cypriaca TaxID=882449 RepID=A0A543GCI8_9PSEU|nr:alcohol dehydrogenase catalytic domain-containing protein [Pseudonocardia cypriaca]TQM43797.1 D-arabinose 1-dehydrogenase-like Zn-dependent alcohol dehydrogenase [Pseudonocardia cypriaca]